VVLNDQELRHAKWKGEFITLMEAIADDEWWTDMRVVTVRQVRRMEDVEYISELFIALMAGPQDKKSTIDDYYADFEATFPEKDLWADRFKHTRDLLESILGSDGVRAWNGKSDFYSLFMVLGGYVESGKKINAASRGRICEALSRFRDQVNQAKRRDNTKKFSKEVHAYADAVTRAATDVSRRKIRFDILHDVVEAARKKP
jgi:hypothetical protein